MPRKRHVISYTIGTIIYCLYAITTHAQVWEQLKSALYVESTMDTASIIAVIDKGKALEHVHPDSALQLYQKALQLSKQDNYRYGILHATYNMANLYANTGSYKVALALYEQAIPYCYTVTNGTALLPEIYNGIACVYQYMDNYEAAAHYLYKAAFAGSKPSTLYVGGIYNNFAMMLLRMQQGKQALDYLDKAEAIARIAPNHDLLVAGIYLNKGVYYTDNRNWAKGQQYYEKALQMGMKNDLVAIQKIALINIGNIYLTRDMPEKAADYLQQAYKLKGYVNPIYSNAGMAMLGVSYYRTGRQVEGINYIKDALRQAEQLQLGVNMIEINKILAQIYEDKHSYAKALDHQKTYTALKDSFENLENTKNVNQLEIKYRIAEKDRNLIEKQLLISKQENYLKKKNIWIIVLVSGVLIVTIVLLALYRINIHKQHLQAKQIQLLEQEHKLGQFKAIMQGEENERSRVARELHDGLGGMLAAVKMNFSTLQNQYESLARINNDIQVDDFFEIQQMLDDVSNEVRKTAYNMMPDILVRHGIAEALRMYIEQINAGSQLYINLQISGRLENLNTFFELSLYRIIQELVQNIIKHSNASNALIQIQEVKHLLTILVKDNGDGFDASSQSMGLGLQNVQFRVESLNGNVQVRSSAATGTSVIVIFNISELKGKAK